MTPEQFVKLIYPNAICGLAKKHDPFDPDYYRIYEQGLNSPVVELTAYPLQHQAWEGAAKQLNFDKLKPYLSIPPQHS